MPEGPQNADKPTQNTSAPGFDPGWAFCFSVANQKAGEAETILGHIYANAAIRLDRLPASDINEIFRPKSTRVKESTVFIIRQTTQTHLDIGLLAGEAEDAFTDADIPPGPALINMAAIEGVRYTFYRNETDPNGNLILPADWAELAKARPPHQLYNPFLKPDPWVDLVYEYSPSAADLTPAPAKTSTLLVEDFDKDLGNLLNSVFSGIESKYLTQPDSAPGWIFDNNFGGEPMYKFFACPETIKPVRQTLRKAGVPFHHTESGGWHGVIIAAPHFDQAQSALQRPDAAETLKTYYHTVAKSPPEALPPKPTDDLFVSDI